MLVRRAVIDRKSRQRESMRLAAPIVEPDPVLKAIVEPWFKTLNAGSWAEVGKDRRIYRSILSIVSIVR